MLNLWHPAVANIALLAKHSHHQQRVVQIVPLENIKVNMMLLQSHVVFVRKENLLVLSTQCVLIVQQASIKVKMQQLPLHVHFVSLGLVLHPRPLHVEVVRMVSIKVSQLG